MRLTNRYNMPQSFVTLVESLIYDPRESDPNRISITTLINNPRVRLLTLQHWDEIEEDVSNHLWRIMGNAVHYVMAKIEDNKEKSKNQLIETKIIEVVDGLTIVGKLDLYDGNLKSIEDYKFTSVFSAQMGEHDDWENQLNPYAWLLRKSGFVVEKAYINAILKDWRKSETLRYDDYPPIPFKRIPVKLWDFDKQQAYVEERVRLYKLAMSQPIEKLPICSDTERWYEPGKYAIYKNENKTATRLLDTPETAAQYMAEVQAKDTKSTYRIDHRPGLDRKCTNYCLANKYCSYWKEKYGNSK